MRVLIVEDEERLALTVARGLRRTGWAVDVAHDGRTALHRAQGTSYDVIVLDRDLPAIHGDEVCRRLVARPDPPRILMLTASTAISDRVTGLALGADDYLCKPFAFDELVARLKALHRRNGAPLPLVLEHNGVTLDPARRTVIRGERDLTLTPKEFGVLEELMRAQGAVVSTEHLLEHVWEEHLGPETNTVRVTVMNLRRKLGTPDVITTVIGRGYRLA